jgi:hypothetical protein
MKNKVKKYYYCRHCGKAFERYYMAEICFDLDMKLLQQLKKQKI